MNKLNPIYILVLVVTIFFIVQLNLSEKKQEYSKEYARYTNLEQKAKEYSKYKQTWFNKQQVVKKIDNIIKSSSFRNEKILKQENNNTIRIKIQSQNPKTLNRFLNRFLNERFLINKLNVQKESISLEVGLK